MSERRKNWCRIDHSNDEKERKRKKREAASVVRISSTPRETDTNQSENGKERADQMCSLSPSSFAFIFSLFSPLASLSSSIWTFETPSCLSRVSLPHSLCLWVSWPEACICILFPCWAANCQLCLGCVTNETIECTKDALRSDSLCVFIHLCHSFLSFFSLFTWLAHTFASLFFLSVSLPSVQSFVASLSLARSVCSFIMIWVGWRKWVSIIGWPFALNCLALC